MKRKIARIDGRDPWEVEIKIWISKGVDPETARFFTIERWMRNGDLRPLAAAIQKRQVDGANLLTLADLIDDGRLSIKARGRGSPKQPGRFARDFVAFRLYDRAKKSEEEIAAILGMSRESVHQAVIAMRKAYRTVK